MRVWMKRIFLLAVMACYLTFAYLLYQRWVMTEHAQRGPVPFTALIGEPTASSTMSASQLEQLNRRVKWSAVLTPLWVADSLTVCAHVSLLIVQHTWRPLPSSLNARIEHASGALRAVLYAVFKVLLIGRLSAPMDGAPALSAAALAAAPTASPSLDGMESAESVDGGIDGAAGAATVRSWWLIFAPIYAAAILQMVLHSCKTLEGGETLFRGRESSRPRRRPGFALTLDDTLAFNISLHLNGGARAAAYACVANAALGAAF